MSRPAPRVKVFNHVVGRTKDTARRPKVRVFNHVGNRTRDADWASVTSKLSLLSDELDREGSRAFESAASLIRQAIGTIRKELRYREFQ